MSKINQYGSTSTITSTTSVTDDNKNQDLVDVTNYRNIVNGSIDLLSLITQVYAMLKETMLQSLQVDNQMRQRDQELTTLSLQLQDTLSLQSWNQGQAAADDIMNGAVAQSISGISSFSTGVLGLCSAHKGLLESKTNIELKNGLINDSTKNLDPADETRHQDYLLKKAQDDNPNFDKYENLAKTRQDEAIKILKEKLKGKVEQKILDKLDTADFTVTETAEGNFRFEASPNVTGIINDGDKVTGTIDGNGQVTVSYKNKNSEEEKLQFESKEAVFSKECLNNYVKPEQHSRRLLSILKDELNVKLKGKVDQAILDKLDPTKFTVTKTADGSSFNAGSGVTGIIQDGGKVTVSYKGNGKEEWISFKSPEAVFSKEYLNNYVKPEQHSRRLLSTLKYELKGKVDQAILDKLDPTKFTVKKTADGNFEFQASPDVTGIIKDGGEVTVSYKNQGQDTKHSFKSPEAVFSKEHLNNYVKPDQSSKLLSNTEYSEWLIAQNNIKKAEEQNEQIKLSNHKEADAAVNHLINDPTRANIIIQGQSTNIKNLSDHKKAMDIGSGDEKVDIKQLGAFSARRRDLMDERDNVEAKNIDIKGEGEKTRKEFAQQLLKNICYKDKYGKDIWADKDPRNIDKIQLVKKNDSMLQIEGLDTKDTITLEIDQDKFKLTVKNEQISTTKEIPYFENKGTTVKHKDAKMLLNQIANRGTAYTEDQMKDLEKNTVKLKKIEDELEKTGYNKNPVTGEVVDPHVKAILEKLSLRSQKHELISKGFEQLSHILDTIGKVTQQGFSSDSERLRSDAERTNTLRDMQKQAMQSVIESNKDALNKNSQYIAELIRTSISNMKELIGLLTTMSAR
jgi:hypothetical protein